ncbi:MAG TPA: glycosyltransferase family 39 protein [Methanomicrobiales archaeon]|jgi:4-amino-4-deoxy-L-arabinose transferase-like glycosyltransferase|nr:glycosyltransferase family 39 protein [Methanomicrobiales archaeon]
MAKKAKETKQRREKGAPEREPGCELEGPATAAPVSGCPWCSVVDAIRGSRYLRVLLLLTILGAFLRLFQLGSASLWLDEATTLTIAREPVNQIWNTLTAGEFNPPLFYWIEHAMLAFGESEVILRIVPALFGILTIPVFYFLGTEILDRNTGILAAALLAFSPFAIFYSQEARAYALMLFFYALAFLFFLRLLKSWGRRDALLFGAFSALAFWTHFYAFVPVLALFLFAIAVKAREMARDIRSAVPLALSVITFSVLSLPLLYYAVKLFFARTSGGPSFGIQGLDTIVITLVQISGFSEVLACVFTGLFIVGVAALYPKDRRTALLLAFALVFPLLVSVFLSYRMPMVPRYLIYLLAAFLPGVALALRPCCSLVRSRNLVYGALILALMVNLPVLVPYYSSPQKDDWRGLSQELGGVARPGDLVIAAPGYIRQPLDYYYRNDTAGTLESGIYTVSEAEGLIGANPGGSAWFIVTGDIQSTDPQGLLVTWLAKHSTPVWRDKNGGILLLKYSG